MMKTRVVGILLMLVSIFFFVSSWGNVEKPIIRSNAIWKTERYELTSQSSWINMTLNPLTKAGYTATGRLDIVSGAIGEGPNVKPRVDLWIVSRSGLDEMLSGKPNPTRGYGLALIPSKPEFEVAKPDYNGVYYFYFYVEDPILMKPLVVAISLTETWTEVTTERELNGLNLGLAMALLLLGIYLTQRRRKPPGLR